MKKRKRCTYREFEWWEEESFNPGTPLLPRGYSDKKVNVCKLVLITIFKMCIDTEQKETF